MAPSEAHALLEVSDAHAVMLTRPLQGLARQTAPAVFTLLRALETASAALGAALAVEENWERAVVETEVQARGAQERLRCAVEPRLEEVAAASVRREVATLFGQWSDPYATDLAGLRALDRMQTVLAGTGLCGGPLDRAVKRMRVLGRAHDRAVSQRNRAIARRVSVRARWNDAAGALLSALPPAVLERWWHRFATPPAVPFPEAAWFSEGEE